MGPAAPPQSHLPFIPCWLPIPVSPASLDCSPDLKWPQSVSLCPSVTPQMESPLLGCPTTTTTTTSPQLLPGLLLIVHPAGSILGVIFPPRQPSPATLSSCPHADRHPVASPWHLTDCCTAPYWQILLAGPGTLHRQDTVSLTVLVAWGFHAQHMRATTNE